jgi:predicted permease
MSTLVRDLRYAFRAFARNPGFTVAAILSLAIGIGANTAIFSITSALLLRPLPYKDADRIVILWNSSPGLGITRDWFSTAQYFDIKNNHQGFESVAIAIGGNYPLTGNGEPQHVGVIRMSNELLKILGAQPQYGRLFTPEDDKRGASDVAILSYGLWRRSFGADPHMIGRSITVNARSYQVVGIMPRDFSLPREVLPTLDGAEQSDVLLPLPLFANAVETRAYEDFNVIAKLKPGVTLQEARAEMDTITGRLRQEHPDVYPANGHLTFIVLPLLEQVVGNVRHTLWLLLAAVACVLLIACANVANLLLARAVGRQREIAVRAAVGASSKRIVSQLLTESVFLAVCGGVLGIILAFISIYWTRVLGPQSVPRINEIGLRGDALLFTLLISVVSGILFGLAPAFRATRLNLLTVLRDSDRGSSGASAMWGRGNNLRRLLVIAELAISVVVLIAAGLLLRSFVRLQHVAPGFSPANVLTLELSLSDKYYDPKIVRPMYQQLWPRLERLPGVVSAGGISALPMSGMDSWGPITVEGMVLPQGEKFINVDERITSGDYFQTLQIPLLKGRLFNDQDSADSPKVAVIDEYMAQQIWPNQDPLGKRVSLGELSTTPQWVTIIGVVGRIKQEALDSDSRMALYMTENQFISRVMNVVVRTQTDPASLTSAVNHEMHELDPGLPTYNVLTMEQRIAGSLARRRFSTTLLGVFAGLALILATIGIYGVMAYLVNQGTREIGIRMALGATQRTILALIVSQGLKLALSGVLIGVVASFVLGRLVSGMLFGVTATDPVTFSAIAGLLILIALIASFIPALRAARIDPMVSLRSE